MTEAGGAAGGLPTVAPDPLTDRGPHPASHADAGGGLALPPAQLTLGLDELAHGGVALPARWAPELAELAAVVERGTDGSAGGGVGVRQDHDPGPSGAAEAPGLARPPEVGSDMRAGAGAGAGDRAGVGDRPAVGDRDGSDGRAPGPEQVAAFEDLHARLRQVLGALDAG